jgi:hypothetical protein
MVGKRYPASVRDRIRQYMLAQEPDKKITLQKISAALGVDHESIVKNMSGMIRRGEPFEVVTRGKAWRLAGDDELPLGGTQDDPHISARLVTSNVFPTAGTRKGDPSNDADILFGVRSNGQPQLTQIGTTKANSVVLEDEHGMVWIARRVVSD